MRELWELIEAVPAAPSRRVVSISGLGGVGKTTLAIQLATRPELRAVALHLDWFLRFGTQERTERMAAAVATGDSERIEAEEKPVNWYDWDAFLVAVNDLRNGGDLRIGQAWNQQTGEKDLAVTVPAAHHDTILCEGLYLLHPSVIQVADVAVLLETSAEAARQRADKRDEHRSDTEHLAHKQRLIDKYDLPYFDNYAASADIVVDSSDFNQLRVTRIKAPG